MGMLRNVLGDTVDQISGCGLVLLLLLPFGCVAAVIDSRKEAAEKAKTEQSEKVDRAESCRVAHSMSEHDAIQECRDNAATFGRDISVDPTRLADCLENFRDKIASCEADGL